MVHPSHDALWGREAMEILDSYRRGRTSRVQPVVDETETVQSPPFRREIDRREQFSMNASPNQESFRLECGGWRMTGRSNATDVYIQHLQIHDTLIDTLSYWMENSTTIMKQHIEPHMSLYHVDWNRPIKYFHDEGNDDMQAAGDYAQSVERAREHLSENSLESYIQQVLEMNNISREIYTHSSADIKEIIHQEARALRGCGRSVVEGMWVPIRGMMQQRTEEEFNREYMMQPIDPRPHLVAVEPKPTEQELLQKRLDLLLKNITTMKRYIENAEDEIIEEQASIREWKAEIDAYQGELELLTQNLTVDENRQLVPKEVEDCPRLTVTSLPKKRKWWQVWKPKVMPGVELVL